MTRPPVRLFSWNVNGLRACGRKGFLDWLHTARPDVLGVQELRATADQLEPELHSPEGYHTAFHAAERAGYSGVALYSRMVPAALALGALGEERFDREGRLIVADYGRVLQHAEAARRAGRSVVICGDVNTAHQEIDLANPRSNVKNTGFLPEERAWVSRFLDHGWVDVFRRRHPGQGGHYTWWSNRMGARARNVGWRIDYFFVSPDLEARVVDARIHPDVMGSDNCPVELALDLA